MIVETSDDWWDALESTWAQIVDLAHSFGRFDPSSLVPEHVVGGVVTAKMTTLQAMEHCRSNRDPTLARFLFGIWDAAPDNPGIHSLAGWSVLCDLLSEEWVLHEEVAG